MTLFDLLVSACCEADRALLVKQDIPEVSAVLRVLERTVAEHWREAVSEAVEDLEERLLRIPTQPGFRDVEPVATAEDPDEAREEILLALFLALREALGRPLSPPRAATVRSAVRRLARAGAVSQGLVFGDGQQSAQRLLLSGEREVLLLLRGHVQNVEPRTRQAILPYLSNGAARRPATAAELAVFPARRPGEPPRALQELLDDVRRALDARGSFVPAVLDVWAYRQFNLGIFEAGAAAGAVAFEAVNNPPLGPDGRTTPFCRYVHGRIVSIDQARAQVRGFTQAVLEGDVDGMVDAWPLLSSQEARDERRAADRFAAVGFPPYHWLCRTIVRPVFGV
ncbi:MAG: hypothetical protein ACF8XB_14105 [Planctomycetota bacterium JB042]